jgi:hypothetical protein
MGTTCRTEIGGGWIPVGTEAPTRSSAVPGTCGDELCPDGTEPGFRAKVDSPPFGT